MDGHRGIHFMCQIILARTGHRILVSGSHFISCAVLNMEQLLHGGLMDSKEKLSRS